MDANNKSTQLPPATKWIQNSEDSDTTDSNGNKLRPLTTLSEEAEYTKGGKKRMIVKRKRRRIEDGLSDEEEDPYTLINIEDILSPIEVPTDIVRRPALRRILRSTQIDALSKTSMEFIEGEKNFNKILCRLSAILHQDDPRYLDLSFDRTPTQIKKYKEDTEAAKAAAVALTSAKNETVIDDLDPKELAEKVKEAIRIIPQEKEEETMSEQEEGVDVEARSIVKRVKELLLENINYSNEYMSCLQEARNKLCKASMQKETLWKELLANAKEEDRRTKSFGDY
ncbi:hypothetical protein G6F57_008361 [Rhizopus arrhizus]|uniref:Transcriptional regulatory protein RXT2 N-terminal domain-containing protein n=1 Tax=Rhizopus oryzae TaxID=64495 RepID=A0A9P6WYV7_RHIOR|nr:hypothetical protein G6F23_010399 [Rhizopus arrhizus]KAG0753921.1 hypothetical protein G6F24_012719 [Rhizopus arrhizus]KAG0775120.1 hypothetical protein G6F22_013541 [Rhizopus arrhizus]KAG0786472.1 hypothetical protein G6F21_008572 [Rhizopus arrhizus]KAG0804596.1 hypothetical protein G6F20_012572 [Rhizopus arrhizus]